jgi:hypothetical protein
VKHLAPAVTCLVTAHLKPTLVDTLDSIVRQTRRDVAAIVLDSGQWVATPGGEPRGPDATGVAQAYALYRDHPMIEWVFTGESAELRRDACPVAWCFNQAVRAGLVRGRYMCTMYDDDVYDPEFFARMAGYLDDHPDALAVWCTEDRVTLGVDGTTTLVGRIEANGPRSGAVFDCLVDGAQVMWRREVLDMVGDPWLPEDPTNGSCRHSDGIFLDKLGGVCTVYPVQTPQALVTHRFTRWSTYSPS